jgi:hypothetical protein
MNVLHNFIRSGEILIQVVLDAGIRLKNLLVK